MNKFDYKCVSILGGINKITRVLHEYGIMGWELVYVHRFKHYFKRSLEN